MGMAKVEWPKAVTVGSATVRIYRERHPRNRSGWAYIAAWHTPAGRRRAKFATPAAALDEARLRAAQLAAGKVIAADMTGSEREELLSARQLAEGMPLLSALREWRAARKLVGGDILAACEHWRARNDNAADSPTVADAVARFLRHKSQAERVNIRAGYARTLPALVAALGSQTIRSVRVDQLETHLGQYVNPGSRNSHRKRIVALWRWARKRGLLPLDVLTVAERTSAAREHRVTIGLIAAAELRRAFELVAKSAPPDLRAGYLAALALAAFCGLRRAEIHGQLWDDIDLTRALLRVSAAKPNTPARRLVPIPPAGVAWLRSSARKAGPICANLALDRIRDICRTAGLNLAANGFRHSYISARVTITGDIPRASIEAGNSPSIIHRHYRELLRQDEAEAWFAVTPPGKAENVVPFTAGA